MGNLKRLLFLIFTIISFQLFSQSPEKINYQSIVRDLAGNVIQNQPISLRMSILSDSINGTIVYQETFQPTTNNFGLVNIKIGEGTPVIATMSSVDWSNGPFFLESAVDVTGGTNYIVVSTSQFMSVPYALYASESPLDTTQVQNIVNQQTNNFLDSTSIQNMIDSSVLNIDSTLIASWGYIDSNSIMILINNNSLDSTTIQNMIDNSIVNIDSSTVASWGYLDSSTIQILINNSTIDSSSVSNWGYLDSTTIQNIITLQTNNYLDSSSVQNMIDNSFTNIDSSTVASWGYIDSSSIMILINNNTLDSSSVQNMIDNSVTNIDSSTVASWGYLDSSSIIALISNGDIDSSSVASWGYLDSVSIQNMINNSSLNVDSTMIANFGFVAGPHTINTDTHIDSTGIANYGFVTYSQVLDSSTVQNMINNSSSNLDSTAILEMGFVDSSTVQSLIAKNNIYLEISNIYPDSGLCNNYPNTNLNCLSFVDAQLYCENLNENGHSDWFLPSMEQLTYATSGGAVIPDYRTTDWIWTSSNANDSGTNWWKKHIVRLKYMNIVSTSGTISAVTPTYNPNQQSSQPTNRCSVRCVRIK